MANGGKAASTKIGRPRGLNINPFAVLDRLDELGLTKTQLCVEVGISAPHFADMLSDRRKGVSRAVVKRMALFLKCSQETIAPELSERFVAVRVGDAA